jgi:translin
MQELEEITRRTHQAFDERTQARDKVLAQTRLLTRFCAHAIRAAHRQEPEQVSENLDQARQLVEAFQPFREQYPDIYFAGYTQDALKEYAEANLVNALINHLPLPAPEELRVEHATYLQGLAEAVGELRRRCLDLLLHQQSGEAEQLLSAMDDIYDVLVTMDYPDAITGGLRRLTDIARSIIERTRGDLTLSLRQEILAQKMQHLDCQLEHFKHSDADDQSF